MRPGKRWTLWLALLLLCISTTGHAEEEADPKTSPEAEKIATERRAAIEKELSGLGDHEWAGQYYFGDGLGVNISLSLAPTSGYLFEWHGCLGLYDRNYGAVTHERDRVRLQFTFPNKQQGFQGISSEFLPVRWGARHYLIPIRGMVDFCNAVNDGSESHGRTSSRFLLRRGDEQIRVSGFPGVPPEYRAYLLAKPVSAQIVSVGKYVTRPSIVDFKFKDTPVTLDKGTNHGLRVGMELHVVAPGNAIESVKITKEEPDRCEGLMTQMGEHEAGPKVGWKLSTRAPWNESLDGKGD
jgi:hypothetical protein